MGGRTEHPFLQACRREPARFTPVWLMRQAGRYMAEYRAIRSKLSFLELCKRPDEAAEVTLLPVEKLGVDAAIIFADILLVLEPMGIGLEFTKGEGPAIRRPVRNAAALSRLTPVNPVEAVPFVFEAIRLVKKALAGSVPLIGFAGAPFTLASYLIEGGPSSDYLHAKRLMRGNPRVWYSLLDNLARITSEYLSAQIAAGVDAVQLFDSWVGCLSPDDYREYVLPHTRAAIRGVTPGVPVIHFGTGTAGLLELMREAGGDVIGLDWRVDLGAAWERVGHDVAVQGNLDPTVLLGEPSDIRRRVKAILDSAGARPGHIFNLGHGVLPQTPVDHVVAMVEAVHEFSRRPDGGSS
jgi:uroporphyrinogen decarboxylase